MSLTNLLVFDRTGMLGGVLGGLPTVALYGYLLVRLLIPVGLIVLAARGATPTQRIGLVRAYLLDARQRD